MLYNYIKKMHPEYPVKKISKTHIQDKLFKNAKDAERSLFDTTFRLTKVLKEFLVKRELENNQSTQDLIFLSALKSRRLDTLFFQEIEDVEKKWKKNSIPGIEHLYEQYRLKAMYISHPKSSIWNKKPIVLTEIMQELDKYYLAKKLWLLMCTYINQFFANEKNGQPTFLTEEVLHYASLPEFQEVAQIKLFRYLATMLKTKNVDSYQEAKHTFFKQFLQYNKIEQNSLVQFFICCCEYIGGDKASKELFEINKFAIEQKIIFTNNYIKSSDFINTVNLGCKVNQLNWTTNFVSTYGNYLELQEQENTILFCNTILAITKKDFDTALDKLLQIKFENVFWVALTKCMRLQCYYKLKGYEESFISLTNSINQFLKRKEMFTHPVKQKISLFVNCTQQMQKIKIRQQLNKVVDETKVDNLFKKISCEKNMIFKNWLLDEINRFKIS